MNETQKRLAHYVNILPKLRDKVISIAFILAVSLSMFCTATFAWVVLSKSPEVSGAYTTISANGNLEIALASPSGSEPGDSAVGDSMAAEGQTIAGANITWGNLVNLSDPVYGLENLVLRPAILGDTGNLLVNPLKGADYSSDGRVGQYLNTDYCFTSWVEPKDGVEGYFKYYETPQYGVRAISTVKETFKDTASYQYKNLMTAFREKLQDVDKAYQAMITNSDYINSLAGLIGDYMTDKFNGYGGTTAVTKYIQNLYNMMIEFDGCAAEFESAILSLANIQVYNKYGPDTYGQHIYQSYDKLYEAYVNKTLAAEGVTLECFDEFVAVKKTIDECLYGTDPENNDCLYDYNEHRKSGGTVTWGEIESLVNKLANIADCTVSVGSTTYRVGSIGKSDAIQLLGKDVDAKITKGCIKDFEQLTGCKMNAKNVDVSAKYILTVTMTAKTITTSAIDPYLINIDITATDEVASQNGGSSVIDAKDTYGMAIDFWVRTNASESYLTLEGQTITETTYVREIGKDVDGKSVELWTIKITTDGIDEATGEQFTIEEEIPVYYYVNEESGHDGTKQTDLRNATTHEYIYRIEENEDGTVNNILITGDFATAPVIRNEEIVTVLGYEGENRVWEENTLISVDSTTQGGGSCYIFYADDASRDDTLRLLSKLRIAFLDSTEESNTYGKIVALAKLDTEHYYSQVAKITVPMVLYSDGSQHLTYNGEDLAILPLEQNKATLITAIVYLDGEDVTNNDVLAANEIDGRINLQFGSSVSLTTAGDETLELATRTVSASVKKTSSESYGDNFQKIEFDFDEDDDFSVNVRVIVDGEQPKKIEAFFMRKLNDTQGSREKSFTLSATDTEGVYEGTYAFDAPGTYVLQIVQLDGIDYDLPDSAGYPTIVVNGFAISSVGINGITSLSNTIYTASNNYTVETSLSFASQNDRSPKSVQLRFSKDDGTYVTSVLRFDTSTNKWNGTATFSSSGKYTLTNAIFDGDFFNLDSTKQYEFDLYLGITVKVTDDNAWRQDEYKGEPKTTNMYVEIFDNSGEEIKYLSGVSLYYLYNNSPIGAPDAPNMKWDSAKDCYSGAMMLSKPGIYKFDCVVMKIGETNNTLRSVSNTTPVYTLLSPDPAIWLNADPMNSMSEYILDTTPNDSNYTLGVNIGNAQGATVIAKLYDADKKAYHYVSTYATGDTRFDFTIPKDSISGYQTGTWEIKEIWLANAAKQVGTEMVYFNGAFDDNGSLIVDNRIENYREDYIVWEMSTVQNKPGAVKIVYAIVQLEGEDESFGTDGTTYTFLQSATTSPITVTVNDQNGEPINGNFVEIASPTILYTLELNSWVSHGGYSTGNSILHADGQDSDLLCTMTSAGESTFTLNGINLLYAGKYVAKTFEVKVNVKNTDGTSTSVALPYNTNNLDIPEYHLYTVKPKVMVTGVSPYNDSNIYYYNSSTPGTDTSSCAKNSKGNEYSDFSAVVYTYCQSNSAENYVKPQKSTVTLELLGLNAAADSITMKNTTVLETDIVFDFTNSSVVSREVGSAKPGNTKTSCGTVSVEEAPTITPLGEILFEQIEISVGGVAFSITLDNAITITNPLNPNG